MKTFEKLFDELTKIHDVSTVFNDFLDYCIDQFLINPNLKYFNHENYSEKEYELFYQLFQHWIESSNKYLETHKWFDMLGLIYEEIVQSKYKAGTKGQFFTPMSVCDAIAKITYEGNKNKLSDNVLAGYDSACGSGRTLLAYHSLRPNDVLFAADLDPTSCKMTCLNFLIHGVKGSVQNMDSLTLEWFNGWKINETLDIGMPFTIMECKTAKEGSIVLGVKPRSSEGFITMAKVKDVKKDVPKVKEIKEEIPVKSDKPKTGQMALM